jgi:heme/copper-type cytochrome/quinol oxidase subunit 2
MEDDRTPAPHGGFTDEETERFTGRLVRWGFAGFATFAVIGTLAGVVANAAIHHRAYRPAAAVASVSPVVHVSVTGASKKGPDGKTHDAFSVNNFVVHAGIPIKLVINNTDDVPHSITAPNAGVNVIAKPGKHAYTLLVDKVGRFFWFCAIPCDSDAGGWAMDHAGFMAGYITAT